MSGRGTEGVLKQSVNLGLKRTLYPLAVVLLGLSGCWGNQAFAQVQNGIISGRVRLEGNFPEPKQLPVTLDKHVCGKTAKFSPELIVSNQRGIQNVVLFLQNVREEAVLSKAPVEIDQRICEYIPHVLLAPMGAQVKILNSDPILHNVHGVSMGKNGTFNKMTFKKKSVTMKFEHAGLVKITCDFHHWMSGWIVVMAHPFYALTDKTGVFNIPDVPPGEYTLALWHEKLGRQKHAVKVESGKTTEMRLTLSANTDKN